MRRYCIGCFALLLCCKAFAVVYPDTLAGYVDSWGSVAHGRKAPLWFTHGLYGKRSVAPSSALLGAGVEYKWRGNRWSVKALLEATLSTEQRYRWHVDRAGLLVAAPHIEVRLGVLPWETPLSRSVLSSGDMTLSGHALPIPQLIIATNGFMDLPWSNGWASFYINGSVGKCTDAHFLAPHYGANSYTRNPLWHHKSFYLRFGKPQAALPLTFTLGGVHAAQWGGTPNGTDKPKPSSFADLLRVVMGMRGGSTASSNDRINVLGNQFGHYLLQLDGYAPWGHWQVYHQHYFEDKSGIEWSNGPDGLWGLRWQGPSSLLVNEVVCEYVHTMNQSGGFHILHFHRPNGEGRGGGADAYYNNSEYPQGVTHYGLGLGNALLLPPLYQTEPIRGGFLDNRVKGWHVGWQGALPASWSYQCKVSWVRSWGTVYSPRDAVAWGTYTHLLLQYQPRQWCGWMVAAEVGADAGPLSGRSLGVGFRLRYRWLNRSGSPTPP